MSVRRENVASASVRSLGYDLATQILEIEFVNGGVYAYEGVPQLVYKQLMRASSKGKFVNERIRDAYEYTRVE